MNGEEKTRKERVRENLRMFEDKIPEKYLDLIMETREDGLRHPLFYSLSHPSIALKLAESVNTIKEENEEKYLPKILSKLLSASEWLEQQLVIFEIIAAAFYFSKFRNKKDVRVEWERKFPSGEKRSGISIIRKGADTVRLEVINDKKISHDKRFRTMRSLQLLLGEKPLDNERQYVYVIRYPETGKKFWKAGFAEKDVDGAAEFIRKLQGKAEGKYSFPDEKNCLLKIDKKEHGDDILYPSRFDIVSSFLKENGRIRDIIRDTACRQLLFEEINFILLPAFGGMGDEDIEEKFLGKELMENLEDSAKPVSRRPTGAVNLIEREGCATVHGLIHSSFNYSGKKVIYNPLSETEEDLAGLINHS